MKIKKNDNILKQNKIFLWIGMIIGSLLLIPLFMMQISSEWDWSLADFVIMGILLYSMASLFVIFARKIRKTSSRIAIGIVILLVTIYFWAELAVGIFTNLGS